MTPTNSSPAFPVANAVRSASDKLSDAVSQVKQKVSDLGRGATETMDEARIAGATGLDSAASALHHGGEKLTDLTHSTADKLSGTAEYIRSHDVKSMIANVEQVVKKNPGVSLVAAGVVGFLVGRAVRRRD